MEAVAAAAEAADEARVAADEARVEAWAGEEAADRAPARVEVWAMAAISAFAKTAAP